MRILKDGVIYLIGEIFSKIMPFLLLPYLTRKLGAAGFGELAYYQTFFTLLVIVFGLSQDAAVARYYYFYGKYNIRNVVYFGYLYVFVTSFVGFLVAIFCNSLIICAIVSAAASNCFLSVQLSLRQCQRQVWKYTIIQISSSVLASMSTLFFLEISDQFMIEKRFLSLFLGNFSISILASYWFFNSSKKKIVWPSWRKVFISGKYVLGFGFSLVLHNVAHFVKGQVDRLVLYPLYPAEQVGIYAAGLQVAMILAILLMAINKATIPYYYQFLKNGRLNASKIRSLSLVGIAISTLPVFLMILVPEKIFLWLLGEQYVGVKYFIIVFLSGFGLHIPYYILVNYLLYYGKNKKLSIISLLSVTIYLFVLFIILPLGISWVPLAMLISNCVVLPLLFFQVK